MRPSLPKIAIKYAIAPTPKTAPLIIHNSIFSGIFEYIALHISLPKDTQAPSLIASDDDIAAAKAPAPTIPYSNPDSVR